MKFKLLFLCTFLFVKTGQIEDFTDLFECVRYVIKNGVPFLGIASLDPLHFNNVKWNLTNYWLAGDYTFDKFTLSGLSTFLIDNHSITKHNETLLTINLNIKLNLKIKSGYRIPNGIIFDIADFKGSGNLTLSAYPLHLNVTLNCNLQPTMSFHNSHIAISIKPNVNVTGLAPNSRMSWLVSKQLTALIDDTINNNKKIVSALIDPIISSLIATLTSIEIPPEYRPIVEHILNMLWNRCGNHFYNMAAIIAHA